MEKHHRYECDNDYKPIETNEDVVDDNTNYTCIPDQTQSDVVSDDSSREVIDRARSRMNMKDFYSEEEVEDYTNMIESLGNLLDNEDEDVEKERNSSNDDWESDDDMCVKTLRQMDLESKEDLFLRNEQSRKMLEDELGLDLFLKVYRYLQTIQDDENDELEIGSMELNNLLGEKQYLYQKILYLVLADVAYCEGNDGSE